MVLVAAGLIVLGGLSALMGQKIFRILLPIIGFITGVMVGFGGVQAVFGTGAISLTISLIMALIVGVIMAVLSFLFYEVAVAILLAALGASALTFLGVAVGLGEAGFILTLMAIAGAVIGFVVSTTTLISLRLVFAMTALWGVSAVLVGIMLLTGEVNLDQLYETGVIRTVLDVVDQSFIWFFVLFGGTIAAMVVQENVARQEFLDDLYAFTE